ncbi:MAG: hypothetical protein ACD_62C00085G0002 [uncultured bacterium]|nr:MAG: hypothetical protein ACD_62C00085G0002 [uncultured bacterium]
MEQVTADIPRDIGIIDESPVTLDPHENDLLLHEFGEAALDGEISSQDIYAYFQMLRGTNYQYNENEFLVNHSVGQILAKHGVVTYALRFDPQDPQTITLLDALGISASAYVDGKLTYGEQQQLRNPLTHFLAKSNEWDAFGSQYQIDHDLVTGWLEVSKKFPQFGLKTLFELSGCISPIADEAIDMLLHGGTVDKESPWWALLMISGIYSCREQYSHFEGLPREAIRRVFFGDTNVPEWLQRLGQAVVPVDTMAGRGSSVIISPQGHVATAYHVLYNLLTGQFNEPAMLQYDDETAFRITEENVLYANRESDIVIFQIPELAQQNDLSFIPLSQTAPTEEQPIFSIGFPKKHIARNKPERQYNAGAIIAQPQLSHNNRLPLNMCGFHNDEFIYSNSTVIWGMSGGAMVSSDGYLLGINSGMDETFSHGRHGSLAPPYREGKLQSLLQQIIGSYAQAGGGARS